MACLDCDPNNLSYYPRLWGSTYDPASATWSAADRIDTNGADHEARNPSVALDANQILVVWDNSLNVPSGENNDDILARARTP
jgi:hypothetical protein